MKFKRIKLKNIRSYEDAEINFPEGSLLLSGDIGSGKTTILLAIEFALFGLQPGQKGASILKHTKDSGGIELEFEIDGKTIIITRNLRRKKSVTQEATFISVDGKTQEKSITEIKDDILKLINYPQEFAKKTNLLYRFTVYTPQEQMKQIIIEDPETRLNTLRHIFGIDKYKRIKENSVILISKLRDLSRVKQAQIADLEKINLDLKEKKQLLSKIESQLPEIEKNLKQILGKNQQKQKEIAEIKDKIKEKAKLENEIEKTNLLLITKKQDASELQNQITDLKKKLEQTSKDFDPKEFEKVSNLLEELESQKSILDKQLINLSLKYDSLILKKQELIPLKEKIIVLKKCPTCLQQVSPEHKTTILEQTQKEINGLEKQIAIISEDKGKMQDQILKSENQIRELTLKKSALDQIKMRLQTVEQNSQKIEDIEKQRLSLEKDIKILSEQISTLKKSILELQKFDNLLLIKEKELADITENQRAVEIKKAEILKEIDFAKKQIDDLENQISEKQKTKNQLIYINELENWISGKFLEMISFVEKNVMIKLRQEFSKLFSEWFSILVPEDFVVRLDDDFTPIIEQQDYQLDYAFLSGGEKTAIALAYRLALNQTINSVLSEIKTKGVVILDEPTDGFSQAQLDKMRDVLQQLDVEQLIMVSHDQKIESFVDNIIRLKKVDGATKVWV